MRSSRLKGGVAIAGYKHPKVWSKEKLGEPDRQGKGSRGTKNNEERHPKESAGLPDHGKHPTPGQRP